LVVALFCWFVVGWDVVVTLLTLFRFVGCWFVTVRLVGYLVGWFCWFGWLDCVVGCCYVVGVVALRCYRRCCCVCYLFVCLLFIVGIVVIVVIVDTLLLRYVVLDCGCVYVVALVAVVVWFVCFVLLLGCVVGLLMLLVCWLRLLGLRWLLVVTCWLVGFIVVIVVVICCC